MKSMYGVIALAMIVQMPVAAQTRVNIGARPTCTTCAIDYRQQVVLGSSEEPAGFAPLVQIARSSRGDFAVSSPTFTGELFIYGPDARLKKVIGRRGSGPGEFTRTQFLAYGPQDSLHTIDTSGPRHSVFSPDYAFVRSSELGVRALGFQLQPTGNLFLVAPKPGPSGGQALQAFSPTGTFLHAFDPIDPGSSGQAAFGRHIAVDARGTRWSVGAARYTIHEWGPSGELVRQISATRDWIPDSIPMRLPPNERPPAQIGGLAVDSSGLLWVYVVVPDANWKAPVPGQPVEPNRMFDTLVEVVDPSGSLVATRRFDALMLPIGGTWAYSMLETGSGDRRIQILQSTLSRR